MRTFSYLWFFFMPLIHGIDIADPLTAFTWIHGNNGTITVAQLEEFISKISYNDSEYAIKKRDRLLALNGSCSGCYFVCENITEILSKYGLSSQKVLSSSDFTKIVPSILYRIQNPYCYSNVESQHDSRQEKPSYAAIWGYSLMMVTIINCCALLGFTFTPFMGRRVYKLILAFMIALAVGSLAGSAVLFLLPDALRLGEMEELLPDNSTYIWKSTVVMGGVYMFFILERFLKCMIERREKKDGIRYAVPTAVSGNGQLAANGTGTSGPVKTSLSKVAPVAWMIIFGDGVHNFIDGLSIGAAFSQNIVTGFSLSVAVLCEELPHELGDFAILLNSGMTIKCALLFNFLSACMCYLGLFVGIFVGEHTESAVWIFALAAGMFLYISLVDMMPEVNHFIESDEAKEFGRVKIFIIQNVGLYMGYGLLLLMAIYGDNIRF